MQRVIKSLLLAVALVSCGTDQDSRYKDISYLERPPTLPSSSSTASSAAAYTADDSRIEKSSTTTGLGDKVYLTSSPIQLKFKMPVDKAWYALAQAFKQSPYKVTDYDRAKRVYYVSSGESSDGFFSFLSSNKKINYVLNMKETGDETVVIATLAEQPSDSSENKDNNEAEKLLQLLYGILHDDLKLDYNGA
jgi:uncharacterized lipoprotein